MKSADMIITWPSADYSTWFVSARSASGHVAPTPYAATQQSAFTYLPQLSTNSSSSKYSQVSFIRPLALPSGFKSSSLARASGQSIIYAASSTKPSGSDASASIVQHGDNSYGVSSIDLSLAVAASSGGVVAQASAAGSTAGPWTTYDNIIVLHALCGSLAWAVVAPAAVLVGRLARSYSGWVRIHQLLQSVLTTVLTIVAFALGVVAMNMQGAKHFVKPHTQMGLVIFILLLCQVRSPPRFFADRAGRSRLLQPPQVRRPAHEASAVERRAHPARRHLGRTSQLVATWLTRRFSATCRSTPA